jgi:hypothetical protein
MVAVGSSKMLAISYKDKQSLTVGPTFTHASLSIHSYVNCAVKWSQTHTMHNTATKSHSQTDANNCIKNFTHITFSSITFKWEGHNVNQFFRVLVLYNKTNHTTRTHIFCYMYIWFVLSTLETLFCCYFNYSYLRSPPLHNKQVTVLKIIPTYE